MSIINIFSTSGSLKKKISMVYDNLLKCITYYLKKECNRCIVISDEVNLATPGCGAPGVGCSWRVVVDNKKRILFVSATSSDGNLDGQILLRKDDPFMFQIYNDPSAETKHP